MDQELAAAVARLENERKMGFHLLWYVPACLLVSFGVIIPAGYLAFGYVRAVFHSFSWIFLISPSFYLFCGMTISSIVVPIALLAHVPKVFLDTRKSLTSALVGFGMLLLWSAIFQIMIWGSYPLGYDARGMEHIRMIPFLPWPNESLLHFIWG